MKGERVLRSHAREIWEAALAAVDPAEAVRKHVRRRGDRLVVDGQNYDLTAYDRVWVVGAGKAAAAMGQSLEKTLGPRLGGGILVTKYGHSLPLQRTELLEAGHPLPDANGAAAGGRIARFITERIGAQDLVFCLLSGGGSALMTSPAPGLSLQDKLICTQLLLDSGATIREMNALRKHLSAVKGGGLARLLGQRPAVSLILSDVVGDRLDTIASGPLVPDGTTYAECLEILRRRRIADRVPPAVLHRIREGAAGRIAETPKPGDPIFRGKQNVIVGSNAQACSAAARCAARLGYRAAVLTSSGEGDTRESALFHISIAREAASFGRPLRPPACLISGGETTVQIQGKGLGGRNQEFALHCVRPLAEIAGPCLVASIGTDGTDGPTDAAGAVAVQTSLARALQQDTRLLDRSIENNDSYHFFRRLGDLIVTGPTRTNVMDLRIILIGPPPAPGKRRGMR